MRSWVGPASFLFATLAATPAGAATVVILPPPGSMSQPRVITDGSGDDSVYICTSPSDMRSSKCSVQKGRTARRHL